MIKPGILVSTPKARGRGRPRKNQPPGEDVVVAGERAARATRVAEAQAAAKEEGVAARERLARAAAGAREAAAWETARAEAEKKELAVEVDYAIVAKITFSRHAESLDDALRKAFSELPDDAIVLEAMAFPARVPQAMKAKDA